MKCSGCGSEYSSENMPKFCPECGMKLADTAIKEKEQFSFANTVYKVKCPYCKADNEIHHGFGSCPACSKPVHLYINDDCEIAATSKSYSDSYSDLYGVPASDKSYGKAKLPWGFIIFVSVILITVLIPVAYAIIEDIDNKNYHSSYSSYEYATREPEYWDYSWTSAAVEQNFYYYPGDTFVFDDIEFTFRSEIVKWDMIDNEYSDDYGAGVFAVPVTIKNVKDETHNVSTYFIEYYGSNDIMMDDMSTYFLDSMYFAPDMRSGAEQETLVYMKYTGSGSYRIIFSDYYGNKAVVDIMVE